MLMFKILQQVGIALLSNQISNAVLLYGYENNHN